MIKNKFLSMSLKEQKDAKAEYFSTEEGMSIKPRLNRLVVYGILLFAWGVYIIIDALSSNNMSLQIFYGVLILIIACVFLIGKYYITIKKVNDYLIAKIAKEKKAETKKEVVKEIKKTTTKKAPEKKTTAKKTTTTKTTTKKAPVKKTTTKKTK